MATNAQRPASILTFGTKSRKRTKQELLQTAKEYGLTGCEKLKISELRQLLQAEANKRWNAWFSEWEKNRTTAPNPVQPEPSAPATIVTFDSVMNISNGSFLATDEKIYFFSPETGRVEVKTSSWTPKTTDFKPANFINGIFKILHNEYEPVLATTHFTDDAADAVFANHPDAPKTLRKVFALFKFRIYKGEEAKFSRTLKLYEEYEYDAQRIIDCCRLFMNPSKIPADKDAMINCVSAILEMYDSYAAAQGTVVNVIDAEFVPEALPQPAQPNQPVKNAKLRKWLTIDEAKQKAAEEVTPIVNTIKEAASKEEIIAILQRAKSRPVIVNAFLQTVDEGSYILNYIYHKELRTKAGHLKREGLIEYVAKRIIDLRKKSLIPAPEVSVSETISTKKITPDVQLKASTSAGKNINPMAEFVPGRIYADTDTNHDIYYTGIQKTYLVHAYLVLNRTKKYIKIQQIYPKKENPQRFFVHAELQETDTPREYICRSPEGSSEALQARLYSFCIIDSEIVEQAKKHPRGLFREVKLPSAQSKTSAQATTEQQETTPAVEQPETQSVNVSTIDTSSLQRLAAIARKENQCGYVPFSSRALWHNEIQKYHPEMKCMDIEPIAQKAACADFSALPEDMLLIIQETSEPKTETAKPEIAPAPVQEVKPEAQPLQTSKPQPKTPVQEAKPERKLPTPKSRNQVYDFSKCRDADTLRKMFTGASLDMVKVIAESYREFQPRTDGKAMTKTDYVTAIIRLYFPDYQSEAPAQKTNLDFRGIKFLPDKIYVLGSYLDIIHNRSPRLFKVIRRNKSSITVQEISNPDFIPAIVTECKQIKQSCTYPYLEYISFSRYSKDTLYAYWDYDTIFPYTPGYDVDFDETAYVLDVQEVNVIVDDIPADHEPDVAPATRKSRKSPKLDDNRQLLIPFDDEDTPVQVSTPAKPKTRRPRKPRIKPDYSRQILIDFGEEISDSQINQRNAA